MPFLRHPAVRSGAGVGALKGFAIGYKVAECSAEAACFVFLPSPLKHFFLQSLLKTTVEMHEMSTDREEGANRNKSMMIFERREGTLKV